MSHTELIEWKKKFFNKRGLTNVSGDNLYTYKIDSHEFEDFEKKFRNWIVHRGFINIMDTSLFHQMFVLYAAEWWKRKYAGGPWTWNNILDEIRIDPSDWYPNKRSECVINGLKLWDINLELSFGKRFLGGIAIQGGLPMNLMADNQGSVLRVLNRVFDLVSEQSVDIELIKSWVQNISHYLPRTYQRDEIYSLLTQVISVLTSLKIEVNSDDPTVLMNQWNTHSDKWQNKFPFSISGESTAQIIEILIKKIAHTKPKANKHFILSRRVLDLDADYEGFIQTRIELEEFIECKSLKDHFQIESDEELSMVLTLEIQCGTRMQEVGLRMLLGGGKYKLSNVVLSDFYGEDAYNEVTFILRDRLGNRWRSKSTKLEALDNEIPWVFEKNEQGEYTLTAQGGCKIASKSFLAIIGDNIEYKSSESSEMVMVSHHSQKLNVIRFNGDATFKNEYEEEFIVDTKYSGLKESITLDGKNISDYFLYSTDVYRGNPTVQLTSEDGRTRIQEYRYKIGGNVYTAEQARIFGPLRAFIAHNGKTIWKKTLIILPENSSEEMIRGESPTMGYWKLLNWKVESMTSLTPDVEVQKTDDDKWIVSFSGFGSVPNSFKAELTWPQNNKTSRVVFPFPSKGVHAYQGDSKLIENGSSISLTKMHGVRIDIIPGDTNQVKIEIGSNRSMLKNVVFNEGEITKKLRLIDFKKYFEKYLSLSHSLDSIVNFSIHFDDRKVFSLTINRYGFKPVKTDNDWFLPNDILTSVFDKNTPIELSIKAQRLDVPGVDELEIEYVESGQILLPDIIKEDEPWLMYTPENSDLLMRPTLLSNLIERDLDAENDASYKRLSEAIVESDKKIRLHAIDEVLIEMVNDPKHEDWDTISRLMSEFGYLPLSSLDIWTRAIKNFDFMAMLVCSHIKVESEFIDRFSIELPFLFEFIPVCSFEKALRNKANLLEPYFETLDIYRNLTGIYSVSDWVFSHFENSYKLALYRIFGPLDNHFIAGNEKMIQGWLFDEPDSGYQKLRQGHDLSFSDWLNYNDLYRMIARYKNEAKNLFRMGEEYRSVTINTPLVLALIAYKNLFDKTYFKKDYVMMYRKLKDFDEQWFTQAFNLALLILHYQKINNNE